MTHTRRSLKVVTTLVALVFAGVAFTGCSNSPGTEGSNDQSRTGDSEQTPSFSTDEEFQLAFAECMREQGIDMPDPGSDGAHIEAGSGDGFTEAAEVCLDELGAPPSGSGGARPSDEQHEIFLEMAQCFRDNGLDVPDPAPGESLTVPMDAPQELFEECATAGANQ
ncbi:hypothetical protein K0817_011570 [Microbacterium sp. HD4P20]|uniref:hypothetical protein n=1 Tax=Microbacterium sp. HD4P20 TaxID=2864874 RepID=UPI0020A61C73|nr:hypothetical protein [Microbacterium sp. HD4P20]MCP2637197.1 hypothetical protein [Microbacterium sp. HD4P20]